MLELAEIFCAQAKQRRSEEFGVDADVVIRVRMEFLAVFVAPDFFGLVFPFEVDRAWIPIVLLARHVVAAFKNQNFLSGWSEFVGQSPTAGAAADDNYVVMILRAHGFLHGPFPSGGRGEVALDS